MRIMAACLLIALRLKGQHCRHLGGLVKDEGLRFRMGNRKPEDPSPKP